jgi:hypothetical protein
MPSSSISDADNKFCYQLGLEMARVDALRMKLDVRNPHTVWPEWWMRRALLRANFALKQHNMVEAKRMHKVLLQIGHGPA